MAHRLEHGGVRGGVRVGVGTGQVDPLPFGDLPHGHGLVLPVAVELELPRVAPVLDLRPRGDDLHLAQALGQRAHHVLD